MTEIPLRLVVLIGSHREGRFAPTVSRWFLGQLEQYADFDVEVIDAAEAGLNAEGPSPAASRPMLEAVGALAARMEAADAFVVVTPEYNHSYPASLKSLIDWHRTQWQAKPIGFVSYGGMSGGLRAVEHLRQVFAELHAVTVRDTVSFHQAWERFDEHGEARDPEGHARAAKTMLDQLAWWATTLRTARIERPYVTQSTEV
ncbi:NADPH-dependent FMN reductase [Streptomyces sp. NPDC018059]|uniref:NADPH-dependent FMN reductase n=1 Tax=Streptomyces sp. NPDC018059 TaxID=3365041 RepID=UPI0037B6801B